MKDPNEENKKIKKLQNLSMNVFIQQIVLFGSVVKDQSIIIIWH